MKKVIAIAGLFCCLLFLIACGNPEMKDQKKYEPLEPSTFYPDGKSARELMPNTVARGDLRTDTLLYAGLENGKLAETFPFTITQGVLARGQQRYNIFCAPCHGYDGYGKGMIVQRGFSPPPSFHQDNLRNAPIGHFFDVITNGFGAMYSYGDRVPPGDRWAIIAYIRALQLSQNAKLSDVPPEAKTTLDASK
ncbi:cytochrome c [soil metagenome]